jgi:alpha-L-rhamnosidase
VGTESQNSYILALHFDLLPPDIRQRAAGRLAADIRKRGISFTTGTLGTQFIFDVLADTGYGDLAYDLLLRTEFPSWGYMIRNGATTIWESWSGGQESKTPTGEIQRATLGRNHSELASASGFLFRRIAGIDAAEPGFETIVIRPLLDPRVKSGGGDYDSVMGRISTNWMQNPDGSFRLDVTIPPNTSARIYVPASSSSHITEARMTMVGRNELRLIYQTNKVALIYVGSGSYRFFVSS